MLQPLMRFVALVAVVSLVPFAAQAKLTPTKALGFTTVAEDLNSSTLAPVPPGIPLGANVVQGIMNKTKFGKANGWTYVSAPAGSSLQADLHIDDYYAWVVSSPNVVSPLAPHTTYNFNHNVDVDIGGAVFDFTYTAGPGDPAAASLHFLQVYSDTFNGGISMAQWDGPGAAMFPFYDTYSSTEQQGASFWFLDEPSTCESNPCANTDNARTDENSSSQYVYSVYLVGVNNRTVTLYGGYQWGYTYTNSDPISVVPEPGAWTLMLVGLGLAGARLRWPRRSTSGLRSR